MADPRNEIQTQLPKDTEPSKEKSLIVNAGTLLQKNPTAVNVYRYKSWIDRNLHQLEPLPQDYFLNIPDAGISWEGTRKGDTFGTEGKPYFDRIQFNGMAVQRPNAKKETVNLALSWSDSEEKARLERGGASTDIADETLLASIEQAITRATTYLDEHPNKPVQPTEIKNRTPAPH